MELVHVKTVAALADIAADWATLCEATQCPVSCTPEWFTAWFGAFASDGGMDVLVLREGEQTRGIAPLMVSERRVLGVRLRIAESAVNDQSPYWDLIGDAGAAEGTLKALASVSNRPWDVLWLTRVPESSPLARACANPRNGLHISRTRGDRYVHIRTDGSWDAWAAAHASLLAELRPKGRRLSRLGSLEERIYTEEFEVGAAMAQFVETERLAWKGAAGTAIARREALRAFYDGLAALAARTGGWSVRSLILDGEPIASQLWLRANQRAYLLKQGYVPELRRHSPANVLLLSAVEDCFRDPTISRIGLGATLPGDWKERWADAQEQTYGICISSAALRSRLAHFAEALPMRFKQTAIGRRLRAWRYQRIKVRGMRSPEDAP